MTTITKDDFLSMVRLQHLEVLTSEQLAQNTAVLKGYMEKALTSELSDLEKADSNVMIAEVGSLQQWCVLRNDFSKAVVYTRREQIAWDEPERGEFGELLKARGGTYKLTPENKKLGRVGQKYGEGKKSDVFSPAQRKELDDIKASEKKLGKKAEHDFKVGDIVTTDGLGDDEFFPGEKQTVIEVTARKVYAKRPNGDYNEWHPQRLKKVEGGEKHGFKVGDVIKPYGFDKGQFKKYSGGRPKP